MEAINTLNLSLKKRIRIIESYMIKNLLFRRKVLNMLYQLSVFLLISCSFMPKNGYKCNFFHLSSVLLYSNCVKRNILWDCSHFHCRLKVYASWLVKPFHRKNLANTKIEFYLENWNWECLSVQWLLYFAIYVCIEL